MNRVIQAFLSVMFEEKMKKIKLVEEEEERKIFFSDLLQDMEYFFILGKMKEEGKIVLRFDFFVNVDFDLEKFSRFLVQRLVKNFNQFVQYGVMVEEDFLFFLNFVKFL